MSKTPKSKASTTKADTGKTKRAVIKDLTTKSGSKVVGGTTRLGTRCV